jgi:hypothetical protein
LVFKSQGKDAGERGQIWKGVWHRTRGCDLISAQGHPFRMVAMDSNLRCSSVSVSLLWASWLQLCPLFKSSICSRQRSLQFT